MLEKDLMHVPSGAKLSIGSEEVIEGIIDSSEANYSEGRNTLMIGLKGQPCTFCIPYNQEGIIEAGRRVRLYIPSGEGLPIALELLNDSGEITHRAVLSGGNDYSFVRRTS